MSRPRFLADEDFRFEIVLAVRRLEPAIETTTIVKTGLSGAVDSQILEYAQSNGLLLLSHDVNTLKGKAEQRIVQKAGVAVFF